MMNLSQLIELQANYCKLLETHEQLAVYYMQLKQEHETLIKLATNVITSITEDIKKPINEISKETLFHVNKLNQTKGENK